MLPFHRTSRLGSIVLGPITLAVVLFLAMLALRAFRWVVRAAKM